MPRQAARIFDEYLAAAARAGDRKAFSALAERWQPKMMAHAYRLIGEREAARDVVQEAWADMVKGLGRLDDARAFPAWAYRIVTRRAADAIRKRQRDRKLGAAYAAETASSAQRVEPIETGADAGPLNAALASLPAEQRAAIARTITQGARLILADEPIASLDPASSRKVMNTLDRVNREDNVTVIVSLHQVDYAKDYCKRTIAMRDGEVVFDGPSSELTPQFLQELYGEHSSELFADGAREAREPASRPVAEKDLAVATS